MRRSALRVRATERVSADEERQRGEAAHGFDREHGAKVAEGVAAQDVDRVQVQTAERQRHHGGGEHDPVRHEPVVPVDDRERDEDGTEARRERRVRGDPEHGDAGDHQHGRDGLDERVDGRNTNLATTATSTQNQVAQHRNVVVSADRGITVRAMRAGKDDRLSERYAVDDDVEKAADDQSKQCHS